MASSKIVRVKVHAPDLGRKLRLAGLAGVIGAKRGLTMKAEEVKTRTLPKTPLRDGHLRNSLHAVPAYIRGGTIFTQVAAGGPAAPYAVVQHEDETLHHKVGGAKFLSKGLSEVLPSIPDAIGREIDAELRRIAVG
jgi:hypothetical protein